MRILSMIKRIQRKEYAYIYLIFFCLYIQLNKIHLKTDNDKQYKYINKMYIYKYTFYFKNSLKSTTEIW